MFLCVCVIRQDSALTFLPTTINLFSVVSSVGRRCEPGLRTEGCNIVSSRSPHLSHDISSTVRTARLALPSLTTGGRWARPVSAGWAAVEISHSPPCPPARPTFSPSRRFVTPPAPATPATLARWGSPAAPSLVRTAAAVSSSGPAGSSATAPALVTTGTTVN